MLLSKNGQFDWFAMVANQIGPDDFKASDWFRTKAAVNWWAAFQCRSRLPSYGLQTWFTSETLQISVGSSLRKGRIFKSWISEKIAWKLTKTISTGQYQFASDLVIHRKCLKEQWKRNKAEMSMWRWKAQLPCEDWIVINVIVIYLSPFSTSSWLRLHVISNLAKKRD